MDRSQILNDPEQGLRIALEGWQAGIWTALPCTVVSINWDQLTIVAQPTIQGVNTDEAGNDTFVDYPQLGDVPILFHSCGGYAFTLPLTPGDEVLVIFSSRAIDSWWQTGGNGNPPIENRMHDLSDGFAIPAQMSNPKTANYGPNVSRTSARITTLDGSSYMELAPGGVVNILAPGGLNVTGNIVATGEVTGNAIPLSMHTHLPGSLNAPSGGGPVTGDTGVPT